MGAVIRDSACNFLAGLLKSSPYVPSPLFAEALAMREGLALVTSRGYQNILIESDSLQVTQALCASLLDLSSFGLIVVDVLFKDCSSKP